jgi:ATP-dependent DNA ligase
VWRSWPRRRPPRFVAFDLLAAGGRRDIKALPQEQRRIRLEQLLQKGASRPCISRR